MRTYRPPSGKHEESVLLESALFWLSATLICLPLALGCAAILVTCAGGNGR